ALAAVDHLGVAGFGIEEQEEVMADELHVVERVVNAHGLGGVLLLADDHGAAGLGQIRLRRLRGLRGFGGLGRQVLERRGQLLVGGHGAQARSLPLVGAVAAAAVVLAAVAGAAQSFEEFAVGDVQRAVEIVRPGLGADDRAVLVHGELHAVAELGLPGVLLL